MHRFLKRTSDLSIFLSLKGETFCELQAPSPTAINSTSISVWYTPPVVAPRDNFVLSNMKLAYSEQGSSEVTVTLDSSKHTLLLSGLKKYTLYSFKLEHYGNPYNIETETKTQRTDEDGKQLYLNNK